MFHSACSRPTDQFSSMFSVGMLGLVYLPAAAGGESPNGSQISPCVAAAGREAGTEAVAVLGGGYMSYEEKDTCHMRRRIHVI